MSKQVEQCCGTCRFGKFTRTKAGTVSKRDNWGQCEAPFNLPPVPHCIMIPAYALDRHGVYPENGTKCPVYMKRSTAQKRYANVPDEMHTSTTRAIHPRDPDVEHDGEL